MPRGWVGRDGGHLDRKERATDRKLQCTLNDRTVKVNPVTWCAARPPRTRPRGHSHKRLKDSRHGIRRRPSLEYTWGPVALRGSGRGLPRGHWDGRRRGSTYLCSHWFNKVRVPIRLRRESNGSTRKGSSSVYGGNQRGLDFSLSSTLY